MDKIYKSIISALIFATDEPIKANELIKAIKAIDGEDIVVTVQEVETAVEELNSVYEQTEQPFRIRRIAEGFIYATDAGYANYIGYLSSESSRRRLSQAAVETLSIIAYKQPITKPEVETIRGVNSDYIINTLLEKNLITIKGRADSMGRPLLYGTTDEFLKYFGLNRITDLPKPREIEEIMKDEEFLEQKRQIMLNQMEEIAENEGGLNEDESEN